MSLDIATKIPHGKTQYSFKGCNNTNLFFIHIHDSANLGWVWLGTPDYFYLFWSCSSVSAVCHLHPFMLLLPPFYIHYTFTGFITILSFTLPSPPKFQMYFLYHPGFNTKLHTKCLVFHTSITSLSDLVPQLTDSNWNTHVLPLQH